METNVSCQFPCCDVAVCSPRVLYHHVRVCAPKIDYRNQHAGCKIPIAGLSGSTMNSIVTGHEDLIHDIAYDHYGRFLATCSSDQHIKIFTRATTSSEWTLRTSFKAHEANIFSIAFAPPQYGMVLVSCSEDQTVRIFTSVDDGISFTKVATLSDSGGAVHQVAFAKFGGHGLKLACVGTDGVLRVYHATDPTDLRHWHLAFESIVDREGLLPTRLAALDLQGDFSVDWCPSGTVHLSEFTDDAAMNDGDEVLPQMGQLSISERAVEQMVVSSMKRVVIFRKRHLRNGYDYVASEELEGHTDVVRDVAWASNSGVGGRYDLIATACKDGWVRIYKLTLKRPERQQNDEFRANGVHGGYGEADDDIAYDVALLDQFDDHKGEVWKVSWNLSGTVLSSSGDDGRVRFWRAAYNGSFISLGVASAEQSTNDDMED